MGAEAASSPSTTSEIDECALKDFEIRSPFKKLPRKAFQDFLSAVGLAATDR
jgi:hypothetical protein